MNDNTRRGAVGRAAVNPAYLVFAVAGFLVMTGGVVLYQRELVGWVWLDIMFGVGAAFFISGVRRIFSRLRWRDPKLAERERNETNDERVVSITRRVRARLYDLVFDFEVLICLFLTLRGGDTERVLSYVFLGALLVQGVAEVALRGYYERRM
jgi:hypothetical protein